EKKDLVDLTTTEQDSEDDDDLDKQPLYKRFKIMHLIPIKPHPLVKQFTGMIFGTTSSKFLPTPLREPTPPRNESKWKSIVTKEPPKDIMPFIEEGGSVPKIPNLKSFILPEGTLRQEKFMAQLKEMKRLADLKEREKKSGKSYDVLLQSLTAKFQWVLNQAKRLGLPPPPKLATIGLTDEEKKRKRTEFIKEMFVTEDVKVDGLNRNLIPPPGVVPIKGPVIKEPEAGIFYMNRNTDIVFQRESEFHLTPTVKLIRIQNQIKVNSEIASEMYGMMNYVIEARVSHPAKVETRGVTSWVSS
ncbi:hypothetical protein Tco_1199064, partial [Tanacetum coccineum]